MDVADVTAAFAARHELGAAYEQEIAESFTDRIDDVIAERVEALLQTRPRRTFPWLPLASLAAAIPTTAIAATTAHTGFHGIAAVWIGITAVNLTHALRRT